MLNAPLYSALASVLTVSLNWFERTHCCFCYYVLCHGALVAKSNIFKRTKSIANSLSNLIAKWIAINFHVKTKRNPRWFDVRNSAKIFNFWILINNLIFIYFSPELYSLNQMRHAISMKILNIVWIDSNIGIWIE